MRRFKRLTVFVVLCLLLVGCDLEGIDDGGNLPGGAGVVVANQGNFTDGNGSVTVYDPPTGLTQTAAISNLGSIVQSVALANTRLYVMSNSGDRIDVYDAGTRERVAQILDITSPRYMLVRGSKGYVTSLYGAAGTFSGGKVNVINLASNTKEKEIQVGDNPEGLALVGERLYVANHGFGEGRTVNVISTITEAVVDTIDVDCDGPRFLESDPDGEVFVFCTGRTIYDDDFNEVGETEGAVRVLEGATGRIVDRLTVDGRIGTAGPGQDTFHTPGSGVILAVKDESTVLVFDTRINQQTGRIGPISGDPIGALAYDELAGVFYLGRSSGFTTAGKVTIHLTDGTLIGEFVAGIAPAYILLLD